MKKRMLKPIRNNPPTFPVPFFELPAARTTWAIERGVETNMLLITWGGIGDQICAEPTLRWATRGGGLKDCRVTLASAHPELFAHLPFDDVYDTNLELPVYDDYLNFNTMVDTKATGYQFISHLLTQCVDFPALASFRHTLYTKDKNVVLKPPTPTNQFLLDLAKEAHKYVPVHPGKHWDTKTYPAWWWNRVLKSILDNDKIPILIGASKTKHGGGYVEVDRTGCIDLLDKTSIIESVWLLQQMPVLICSDSSPLHMAVSGDAFVGFVATAKHPDYVTHWRKNLAGVTEWGWRMQSFGLGGMWDLVDNVPNRQEDLVVDKCDPAIIKKWLPVPEIFGPWCKEKSDEYFTSLRR